MESSEITHSRFIQTIGDMYPSNQKVHTVERLARDDWLTRNMTSMKNQVRIAAGLLLLVGIGCSLPTSSAGLDTHESTVAPDSRFIEIRHLIEQRVADDIPSFGISVIHKGEVLWEEAFGWADIENRTAATPHTLYSIASVSKSITATGVMLLAERGDLDLNAPIDEYVGAGIITPLAEAEQPATIQDLLTMTAGFPMGFMAIYEPNPVPKREDLLLHHGGIQVFPPGKIFHYSNFSLGVAEIVVESATGKSFADAMAEVLFAPAGMKSTIYSGSPTAGHHMATNYETDGTPWPTHTSMPAGGAGSHSSVSDLRQYALAHLGYSAGVISPSIRDSMHIDPSEASQGMFAVGWWVVDLGDGMSLVVSDGHGAGMALVQLLPDEDVAVICVMNTRKNDADGQALTNKVANMVFDVISPGFSARHDKFWAHRKEAEKATMASRPTSENLGLWSGYVRTYDDKRLSLELLVQADGDIHVTLEDQYTVLLTEARYRNGMLEGWFPGLLTVDVPFDRNQDILARFLFEDNQARGYLNASFDDARGVYELSSFVYLERDSASQ